MFADFSQEFFTPLGRIFYADLSTGDIFEFILGDDNHPLNLFVKGVGQGPDGALYVMTSQKLGPTGTIGTVFRIVPEPTSLALLVGVGFPMLLRRRKASCAR